MRTMNLRDANQQFSKLVREVEESGETVTILRNGRPAVTIASVEPKVAPRTPEQEAALARLLDPKNHFTSPPGSRFDREEMWEERMNRNPAIRSLSDRPEWKKEPKFSRRRG